MEAFITELRLRQEQELVLLEHSSLNEHARIESAIMILESSISSIHKQLDISVFEDNEAEIHFFKTTMPEFLSIRLYYVNLQRVKLQKPDGSTSVLKKYYKRQLKKITAFFKDYRVFYEYYRSGAGYLDELYFTRHHKQNANIASQTIPIALNTHYCTAGSFTVATILANRLLEHHLCQELMKLSGKLSSELDHEIKWTDTAISLKELVYAFYYRGCFNKGQIEIKQLADYIGAAFGVTLDNIYKAKQEMYFRNNMSSYLDLLRKRFVEGMEESEERSKKK